MRRLRVLVFVFPLGLIILMVLKFTLMPTQEARQLPLELTCCSIASRHKLEVLCFNNKPVTSGFGNSNCNCTTYMLCKLVIVTALSSNHFTESVDFFGSVCEKLPQTNFIVYDLGLSVEQLHAVQSYCNVKVVRKFKFDQYPNHTKELFNYAWKPLIISEISEEYELFLYCDSSCRMTNDFIPFLPNILKFPIVCAKRLSLYHSVFRSTHQGMLDYLGIKMSRTELIQLFPESFQAGVVLIWANDTFKNKILSPWVDCAMNTACISPKGSSLGGCNFNAPPGVYVGCHRFDQSALNLLLIREYKSSLNKTFNDNPGGISSKPVLVVERKGTKHYNNPKSQQCNILYQF